MPAEPEKVEWEVQGMWWSRTKQSAVCHWRLGQDTLGFDHSETCSGEIFLIFQDLCLWKSPHKRQDRDAEQADRSHAGAAHCSITKLHSPIPQTFSQLQLPRWDVQAARLREDGSKSGSDTAG